jgi:SagB-type dehydrogenase family enzyme
MATVIASQDKALPDAPFDRAQRYRLSAHVQMRPGAQGFVVESLITGHRETLPSAASVRLLLSFRDPLLVSDLLELLGPVKSAPALDVLRRWHAKRLLTQVAENGSAEEDGIGSLNHWEPHDLAFHLRSRRGRNPSPVGANWHLAPIVPPEPARRHEHAAILERLPLARADLDDLRENDIPFSRVLEDRRTRHSIEPISLRSLGELLFRTCRVTDTLEGQMSGEAVRKVYPSGGCLHSLEVYVVANRCTDLQPGGYRYDAFDHSLEWLRRSDDDLRQLLREAQAGTGILPDLPSILLIFAPRFRRVTRKYQSLAYHVILQEVGALYQTIYLVGEAMGLAVSAIGSGDSDRFARAFDTDFFAESSVGEMIVGGRTKAWGPKPAP